MTVNYITDQRGKKKAVQISITDWNNLVREVKSLMEYNTMKGELSDTLREVQLLESGKKKSRTLISFLNGL